MPCISGNYNPSVGPLINIAIVQLKYVLPSNGVRSTAPPDVTMYTALMDTGASSTCISQKVADEVGLIAVGKTMMSGATGAKPVDQYGFGVGFVFNAKQNPSGTFTGDLNFRPVQGCVFDNHGFGFEVLLGRDILCSGAFTLSFDGHYILSI